MIIVMLTTALSVLSLSTSGRRQNGQGKKIVVWLNNMWLKCSTFSHHSIIEGLGQEHPPGFLSIFDVLKSTEIWHVDFISVSKHCSVFFFADFLFVFEK